MVKRIFETEDIYIDEIKVDRYFGLEKYFLYGLFDWERFMFVLHCCTYRRDGMPRFPMRLATWAEAAERTDTRALSVRLCFLL